MPSAISASRGALHATHLVIAAALLTAAASAIAAILSPAAYAPYFALIDRDDSITPATTAQLSAIRFAMLGLAGLALAIAAVLAKFRHHAARWITDAQIVARECFPAAGRDTPTVCGLLVVGAMLRIVLLDRPMGFDEADTFNFFATRSYFNSLTDYTAPNNHVLHTLLVRTTHLLFGSAPWVIRLPAFLAGLLVLPFTYAVARRIAGRATALLALALAGAHPALLIYSTNARGYSLVTAAALLCVLLTLTLRKRRSPAAWMAFAVVGIAGMFTVPTMLYALAGTAVFGIVSAKPQRRGTLVLEFAMAAVGIAAAAAALYAPAALRTGPAAILANRYVAPIDTQAWIARATSLAVELWQTWTSHIPFPIALVLAAAFLAGLAHRRSRTLFASLATMCLALMLAQRAVPYARVLVFLAPFASLVTAAGLAHVRARWTNRLSPAALAVILALSAAATSIASRHFAPSSKELAYANARQLARQLAAEAQPADAIVSVSPYTETIRYHQLVAGHPRSRVLAPDVVWGTLPSLETFDAVLLVRPRHPPANVRPENLPSSWLETDAPAFAPFPVTEPLATLDQLELLRLSRPR